MSEEFKWGDEDRECEDRECEDRKCEDREYEDRENAYGDFAAVYDIFMDETPYDCWAEYILNRLKKYGIDDGTVLDLGCGTGCMTKRLAMRGYDMIGVDLSAEMLSIASRKKDVADPDILYICQDMRNLDLYGTVRAVVSVCDCVNYLLTKEDLGLTFDRAHLFLDPGGIFLFDFNTVHKYRDVIGDTVIAENREECSFIWDNYYEEESGINEYDLTFFVKEKGDLFRRFEECHRQRGYEAVEMEELLKKSGFEILEVFDTDRMSGIDGSSERITIVAKKK